MLTDQQLASIYRACLKEIISIRERIAAGRILMEKARERVPVRAKTYRDYPDVGTCLAALDAAFPNSVPTEEHLKKYPSLRKAIRRGHGGLLTVRTIFFPDPRVLVPFVLMLAIHTRYNPETLLDSKLEDYPIEERLGQQVLMLVPRAYKKRSQRRQLAVTPVEDAPDNPAAIIAFLREWTGRARAQAPPHLANRLFLFLPRRHHTSVVTTYVTRTGGYSMWSDALRNFCRDHHLNPFSLEQIRPTMLDLGIVIYDGDLRAARALGDHRTTETTYGHYTSDAQRQRNAERLGEVMALRTRWREADGLIDPRERTLDADQGAATPGWSCLDPYDSPFSPSGKLCGAYGFCPVCPLSQIEVTSPYACAQAHNLLDAVRRARETMAPQAWLDRMAIIEHKLVGFWLPQFSAAVCRRARQLDLPRLPIPE